MIKVKNGIKINKHKKPLLKQVPHILKFPSPNAQVKYIATVQLKAKIGVTSTKIITLNKLRAPQQEILFSFPIKKYMKKLLDYVNIMNIRTGMKTFMNLLGYSFFFQLSSSPIESLLDSLLPFSIYYIQKFQNLNI